MKLIVDYGCLCFFAVNLIGCSFMKLRIASRIYCRQHCYTKIFCSQKKEGNFSSHSYP